MNRHVTEDVRLGLFFYPLGGVVVLGGLLQEIRKEIGGGWTDDGEIG